MQKIAINFVLGGLSLVAIIGGILWFFLVEMSPESALAIVGGLGLLFGWFQTREDKKDQAQNKADIINVIQTEKRLNPIDIEHNDAIRNQKLLADKKLLKDLWQFINWKDLDRIVDQIHNGAGDYDFYKEKIIEYLYFRQLNQERQLHNPELEKLLTEFDILLNNFDQQLSSYADAEIFGDRWIWKPHYKYRLSQEMYDYKHREYRKAVEYGMKMLDKHKELVSVIREMYPDFFA